VPVTALSYTHEEQLTFLGAEWVAASELGDLARTFPDGIDRILATLRAGGDVDAGFAVWC
jgi:hypothetical protein